MSAQVQSEQRRGDAAWRIAVDVGGTFTDLALVQGGRAERGQASPQGLDPTGSLVVKVPSVPGDPSAGVVAALETAADQLGTTASELLGRCSQFVHGTTIATNTVLEGKGARVGLVCTAGFRDSLEIRRGIRADPWDHRRPHPAVLVPRHRRLGVGGRLDRSGRELEPLSAGDVERAAQHFARLGVESVAVCLLHSYLDGCHERRCGELLEARLARVPISISSSIAPLLGEYLRTSTTVVNAALAPGVVPYLERLERRLRELGLSRPLLLLQSNGGVLSLDRLRARPVQLLLSGPAAAVGALERSARAGAGPDLVSIEIGGTSCDVTLIEGGQAALCDTLEIGGYHVAIPAIDIHTVAAGGGTLASVDGAGMLQVGPQGAGARPGPACYGVGGTQPTVTDALLVLGRLRPGAYAGGALVLRAELARRAVAEHVASPLGLEPELAAVGIVRLLEQHLLHAVEQVIAKRGCHPARLTLVAAGGAGPMHAAAIARRLGFHRVWVPRQAGGFCALGMLDSDVRLDRFKVQLGDLDALPQHLLEQGFRELEQDALEELRREGFAPAGCRAERRLDLRYRAQLWSVTVALGAGEMPDPERVRALFEAEHDRLFGHIQPGGRIELTALRVVALGLVPRGSLPAPEPGAAPPVPREQRRAFIDRLQAFADTPVYDGAGLRPGHAISGPALIEEQTTTVYLDAGDRLEVAECGDFVLYPGPAEGAR